MNGNPTSLLNQMLALGDNPDDIRFVVEKGQPLLILGNVTIALGLAGQAALDKLAVATALATAQQRANILREVA